MTEIHSFMKALQESKLSIASNAYSVLSNIYNSTMSLRASQVESVCHKLMCACQIILAGGVHQSLHTFIEDAKLQVSEITRLLEEFYANYPDSKIAIGEFHKHESHEAQQIARIEGLLMADFQRIEL